MNTLFEINAIIKKLFESSIEKLNQEINRLTVGPPNNKYSSKKIRIFTRK
jgi:hypothetical protein